MSERVSEAFALVSTDGLDLQHSCRIHQRQDAKLSSLEERYRQLRTIHERFGASQSAALVDIITATPPPRG